ncbi:MAG: methyltransferase family protein [Anaerolineales bacterium]
MVPWINLAVMLVFIGLFTFLYVRSVSPAKLEAKLGEKAYLHCGKMRAISIFLLIAVMVNYLIYDIYPLPVPELETFNWSYWISLVLALVIAVPTTYMVATGMKDAGDEAIQPDKNSEMFHGIYDRIRHPQTWEYAYFFSIALLLDNPFLLLFSLIWLPLMYIMMRAEEKDLLIRFGQEYENYMKRTGRLLPRK